MTVFDKISGALRGNTAREVGGSSYADAQKRIAANQQRAELAKAAKAMTEKATRPSAWVRFTNSLFDPRAIANVSLRR